MKNSLSKLIEEKRRRAMHFFGTVLIEKSEQEITAENAEYAIQDIVMPYSCHLEVPEYERDCGCVGMKAYFEATAQVKEKLGSLDKLADAYWKLPDEERPEWPQYKKEWQSELDKAYDSHPLKNAADKECPDCEGSGTMVSTYNKDSKWDWYQIGGRWSGYWADYDPSGDPKNSIPCYRCKGTAKESNGTDKCRMCQGTGKTVSWPTSWSPIEEDMLEVPELIKRIKENENITSSYCIITPQGEWLEREEREGPPFYEVNQKSTEEWDRIYMETLEKNQNCYAVIVDFHF